MAPPLHPPGPTFLISGGVLGKVTVYWSTVDHFGNAVLPLEHSCHAYGCLRPRNAVMLECSERLPVAFSSRLLFSPSRDHTSVTVHLDGGAVEPGAKLPMWVPLLFSPSSPSPVMLNFEPHGLRNSFSLDDSCRKNGCGHPWQLVWPPEAGIPCCKEWGAVGQLKCGCPPSSKAEKAREDLSFLDRLAGFLSQRTLISLWIPPTHALTILGKTF
ncbi:hypothetical protein E2320_022949 [Naja naja]|nr:hypothetical protein E2320_022949 [Naja naja]